ncbi:adenylate kinase [bacterium]|nr:adenylate kinase [bacterium]
MYRGIFLGPPGAGKGTQAKKAVAEFGLEHLSPGDILRAEVAAGSSLGKVAKSFMEKGELVTNDVIIGMMKNKISGITKGFILDGFPRTIEQAEALEEIMKILGHKLDSVLNFTVSVEELVFRLSNRLSCPDCKSIFHKYNIPPKKESICDNCGGTLVIRKDDCEEAIKIRMEEYRKKTSPLIEYYEKEGKLININGEGNSSEIYNEVVKALK